MKFTEDQRVEIIKEANELVTDALRGDVADYDFFIDRIESILTPSDEGRSEEGDAKDNRPNAAEYIFDKYPRLFEGEGPSVVAVIGLMREFADFSIDTFATIRTAQVTAELQETIDYWVKAYGEEKADQLLFKSELDKANDSITEMLAQLDAANDHIRKLKDDVRMAKHKI